MITRVILQIFFSLKIFWSETVHFSKKKSTRTSRFPGYLENICKSLWLTMTGFSLTSFKKLRIYYLYYLLYYYLYILFQSILGKKLRIYFLIILRFFLQVKIGYFSKSSWLNIRGLQVNPYLWKHLFVENMW